MLYGRKILYQYLFWNLLFIFINTHFSFAVKYCYSILLSHCQYTCQYFNKNGYWQNLVNYVRWLDSLLVIDLLWNKCTYSNLIWVSASMAVELNLNEELALRVLIIYILYSTVTVVTGSSMYRNVVTFAFVSFMLLWPSPENPANNLALFPLAATLINTVASPGLALLD